MWGQIQCGGIRPKTEWLEWPRKWISSRWRCAFFCVAVRKTIYFYPQIFKSLFHHLTLDTEWLEHRWCCSIFASTAQLFSFWTVDFQWVLSKCLDLIIGCLLVMSQSISVTYVCNQSHAICIFKKWLSFTSAGAQRTGRERIQGWGCPVFETKLLHASNKSLQR